MKNLAVIFLTLCLTLMAHAHQDRVITMDGKKLVELPEKFQPATFDVASGVLSIARKELTLTPFLKGLLEEPATYDLEMGASWYHELSDLPPYLSIHIKPKGRDYSYHILIDMAGVKVLEVEVWLEGKETTTHRTTHRVPVDPAEWREGKK